MVNFSRLCSKVAVLASLQFGVLISTTVAQVPFTQGLLHHHQADSLTLEDGSLVNAWANDAPDDGTGYQAGSMGTVAEFGNNADIPRNPAAPTFNTGGFGSNNMPSVSFKTAGSPPNQDVGFMIYDRPQKETLEGDAEFTMFAMLQIDQFVGALGAVVMGWGSHIVDGGGAYLQLDKGAGPQAGFGGGYAIANTFYLPSGYTGVPKLYTIRKTAGPINTTSELFIDGEERAIIEESSSQMVPNIGMDDFPNLQGVRLGFTGVTVGSEWNPNFQLAEALIFEGALEDADRMAIEDYLAAKYGVALPGRGLPGDYNEDGSVDAADYVVWRSRLGESESLPNDDTAGVGEDDFTRWNANFGNSAGSGAAGARLINNVPEPGLPMLLATAFLAIGQACRRRR